MQAMVNHMLDVFYFEHKKLDELSYRRLSLETFTGSTLDEAEAHFLRIMDDFLKASKQVLIQRIKKGEEFLDGLSKDDPRYKAAENKLVNLINELARFES